MKKWLTVFLIAIVFITTLCGCANNESKQLKLVREMMRLDYEAMTVGDFHSTIEKLCEDAGTTVSTVYHDVSEEFRLPGDDYGPPNYSDAKLADFMTTTLQYSSTEIHAAHAGQTAAHINTVMYMTVPDMTAGEVASIMEGDAEEAAHLVRDNAETLNIYPMLIYYIEGDIHDGSAITVSERNSRIIAANAAVKEYFLSLSRENAEADTLEENLEAEFERISTANSDADMTIHCVVEDIVTEGDMESTAVNDGADF